MTRDARVDRVQKAIVDECELLLAVGRARELEGSALRRVLIVVAP